MVADEILAQRLGLVPLNVDPSLIEIKEGGYILWSVVIRVLTTLVPSQTLLQIEIPLYSVCRSLAREIKKLCAERQIPNGCITTPMVSIRNFSRQSLLNDKDASSHLGFCMAAAGRAGFHIQRQASRPNKSQHLTSKVAAGAGN